MSEQIRDQISAFTDDELSAEECAFLVRQLERNPASRQRVLRYSIMGAALRGELLNPDPDILRRRVRAGFAGVRSVRRPRHSRAALNGLMRWSAAGVRGCRRRRRRGAVRGLRREPPVYLRRCVRGDGPHGGFLARGARRQLRGAPSGG